MFAAFDARHGGLGGEPKFPHVAPLPLALEQGPLAAHYVLAVREASVR